MEKVEWKNDLPNNFSNHESGISLQDQVPLSMTRNADICSFRNLFTCVVLTVFLLSFPDSHLIEGSSR